MRRLAAVAVVALAVAPVARAEGEPTVSLAAPAQARYGATVAFSGSTTGIAGGTPVTIASGGAAVAQAVVGQDGAFRIVVPRLGTPGPYVAEAGGATSTPVTVELHPRLATALPATAIVGGRIVLRARLAPAAAGALHVRVYRDGRLVREASARSPLRLPLDTRRGARLRAVVTAAPADGWLGATHVERTTIVPPRTLHLGSSGATVVELERRLVAIHYALRSVDGRFADDDAAAVLAFQKVQGLPRTGRVDRAVWRRLATATTPRARFGGTHVEVDKRRQVLFEVRGGKVALVVHVSTGATGNTPLGVWHVYRRVTGWDWVLYFPTYFVGGFAIHGYPDVPAYPASHGCVRVPLWVAPRLYAMNRSGEAVYVYQ